MLLASAHLFSLVLAIRLQAKQVPLRLGIELFVQKNIVSLLEGVFLNL